MSAGQRILLVLLGIGVPVPGLLGSQSQAAVCGHRTRSRCQITEFESQEFCRRSGGSDPKACIF